jgi:NADH:ubiquinone oxidoreductase subunit H
MFTPLASGFIVVLFLESKRAPFDHAETESEVVAGYATEYSGSMALIFILSEYIHLIIASLHFILFFCGGWGAFELLSLLPSYTAAYHDPVLLIASTRALI